MRSFVSHLPLVVVLTATLAPSAFAGGAKDSVISAPETASRWRFGAAYAPIFGLDAKFSGLGTFGSSAPVVPIAPGTSYEYDNGYVRVDSSGNAGGQTWNWGYDEASQVSGSQVAMSLTSSTGNGSVNENNEEAQGVDLSAYLRMGALPLAGGKASWGLRGGLHYGRVDIGSNQSLTAGTTIVTDTFTLGSGVMPGAPYSGSFGGPGPLLGDTPVRDITNGTAVIDGSRDLDVHLTTLNFGAYLEFPVTEDLSFLLEGGLSAALADGDYDFNSTTTITGVGTQTSAGSDSGTDVLPGVYLGVSGIYQINDAWAFQLSGRYQYMDSFKLEDNGSEAKLDFGSAFILSAGVVFSF